MFLQNLRVEFSLDWWILERPFVFFYQKPRKRNLCEIDQKVPIFVEKLKKMQPPKITFRSQIEPSIKSYEYYVFAKFQIRNHAGPMDSWKTLIIFFFQKPRKSKNALYYRKTFDFLVKLIKKSQLLLKNSKNETSKNVL